MEISSNIYYLRNHEIDRKLWDACIDGADNGLIYGYSFYLDAMCDNWDGIIIGNYDAVMPLPWRKKWKIKYLYIQPFIQQLGLFGNISFELNELIYLIKRNFFFGDISFNYSNHIPRHVTTLPQNNYILQLNQPYEVIEARFANVLKKNLKEARKAEISISTSSTPQQAIDLFRKHYFHRVVSVTNKDLAKLLTLSEILQDRNMLFIRSAENKNGETLAIGLFLKDKRRIYNLVNPSTIEGRKKKANHLLLTATLNEFSESNLTFDFEGSDLKGVKEFYLQFNPHMQSYPLLQFNNLPFPLDFLHRFYQFIKTTK